MPRVIKKAITKTEVVKPEVKMYRCTICTSEKKEVDFYKSNSVIFSGIKRMCVCKDCLVDLYGDYVSRCNDTKQAVLKVCERFDVYFDDNLFYAVEQQAKAKGSILIQIYFQKVNSLNQYSGLTYENIVRMESKISVDNEDTDSEIVKNSALKWGRLAKDDIEFLESNYFQWTTRHQCQSRAEEILFEEICQIQLDIKKTRESNGDVVKKVEALQKLMTSANIRPLDQNAINSADSTLMMGTIISTIEKNDPCEFFDEYRKKQYSDFMGYKKYFDNWVIRPLKNLMTGSKDFNIDTSSKIGVENIKNEVVELEDGE